MHDVVTHEAQEVESTDLEALAVKIRDEYTAADKAGCARIDHAIVAGKYLRQVQGQIGRGLGGFRSWLERHNLKPTTAYNYIKLANNEWQIRRWLESVESVQASEHFSVEGVLRMLRPARPSSSKPDKDTKGVSGSVLTPPKRADWTRATSEERQLYTTALIDAVGGVDAFVASMSPAQRAELRSLVLQPRHDVATRLSAVRDHRATEGR